MDGWERRGGVGDGWLQICSLKNFQKFLKALLHFIDYKVHVVA